MASRFWVGGTGTWDASNTTNWSATTGGAGGASVPSVADTVTFNSKSGSGTCTLAYSPEVVSLALTTWTGTLNADGSLYTITVNGTGNCYNNAGVAVTGSPSITLSNTSTTARTFSTGNRTYGTITIGGSTGISTTTFS